MLLFCCSNVHAKDDAIPVQGRVLDNMTGAGIPGAKVYLMPSDCIVIDRRLPILQMLKTWNNSVILSLSWRFNVNPKKK